jgi:hypothetical protein
MKLDVSVPDRPDNGLLLVRGVQPRSSRQILPQKDREESMPSMKLTSGDRLAR